MNPQTPPASSHVSGPVTRVWVPLLVAVALFASACSGGSSAEVVTREAPAETTTTAVAEASTSDADTAAAPPATATGDPDPTAVAPTTDPTETPAAEPTVETPVDTAETPAAVPTAETPAAEPTAETPVDTAETPAAVPTVETPAAVPTVETPAAEPTAETSATETSGAESAPTPTAEAEEPIADPTSAPVPVTGGGLQFEGVNLAGAEFGNEVPGQYDIHWTFPTYEEVDFFTSEGMNIFRLPFLWERLQPSLDRGFDQAHLDLLDEFVRYTRQQGAAAVLDPHNYAHYYEQTIGSDAVPIEAFAAFWAELAQRYAGQDHVIFGLMNEPVQIDSNVWIEAVNAAIASIRATGANNLILVPGNYWTGAHSWLSSRNGLSNADALLQVVDPANNFAIEVHQYLDSDHSGTSDRCVSETAGSERLADFTGWLYQHNMQGFLGEFGVGDNPTCLAALDDMLSYMEANNGVWLGWTYWAAGPWWGDYIFEVEPTNGVSDDPQFDVLDDYLD